MLYLGRTLLYLGRTLFAGGVLTLRGLSAHAGAPMARALAHAAMAAADSNEMGADVARVLARSLLSFLRLDLCGARRLVEALCSFAGMTRATALTRGRRSLIGSVFE